MMPFAFRGLALFVSLAACDKGAAMKPTDGPTLVPPSPARSTAPVASTPAPPSAKFKPRWVDQPLPSPVFETDDPAVKAMTCADFANLTYRPKNTLESTPFVSTTITCEAWKAFQHATPAKESFVDGFKLDEGALKVLPAELARTYNVTPRAGTTWAEFSPGAIAKVAGASLLVETNGEAYSLEEIAVGDFDDDGREDLLLRVAGGPKQGTAFTVTAFVVTRLQPNEKLKVLRKLGGL